MSKSNPRVVRAITADRVTAAVLFALGVAMLVGGFTMDRLEVRRIHPASIPGLVPMMLGATLALCAVVLFRSAGAGEVDEPAADDGIDTPSWPRLAAAAAWSTFYALVMIGNLSFVAATALYVGVFAAGFGWPAAADSRDRAMLLVKAVVLGTGVAWGIATLFSEGFLVRLP